MRLTFLFLAVAILMPLVSAGPTLVYDAQHSSTIYVNEAADTIYAKNAAGRIVASGTLNSDDSAIVQALVDATSGDATIFFQKFDGVYKLNTPIIGRKGLYFDSNGATLDIQGINSVAIRMNSTGNQAWDAYYGLTGINGFTVIGSTTDNNPNTNQWLICAENTSRFLEISNINLQYVYNFAWLKGGQYSNRISNIKGFRTRGIGILLDATGTSAGGYNAYNFQINQFEISNKEHTTANPYYNSSIGIIIDSACDDGYSVPADVHITDSYIEFFQKAIINDGKDTVIADNAIRSNYYGVIQQNGTGYSGINPHITGNHFDSYWVDISNYHTNNQLFIAGNTFDGSQIAISTNGTTYNYFRISDNLFASCGIAINGSIYGAIVGNTFKSTGYQYAMLCSRFAGQLIGNDFMGQHANTNKLHQYTSWARPQIYGNSNLTSVNDGTGTGTGSQQTIAHGLAFTPDSVVITPTATGAVECSRTAASDATNIYVNVTSGKTYYWKAEYVP